MSKSVLDETQAKLFGQFADYPEIAENFYLAGGTALALQLGHRKSIDFDFFSGSDFSVDGIAQFVVRKLQGTVISESPGTLHADVSGVKLSFLAYAYPMLKPFQMLDGIRLASVDDIAAMKIGAVSQRGSKKDFFDLYEILKKLSFLAIKNDFLEKFGSERVSCYHVLKSLFYFDDAEAEPDPISLNRTTWPSVKKFFLRYEKQIFRDLLC
jgi:predicted nucleotidyltransferase component of viral defense system